MPAPLLRAVRSLVTITAAACLLVSAVATSAQAGTAPTVTAAQAKKTVPPARLIPGSVTLTTPVLIRSKALAIPCVTKPKVVTLQGASVEGNYLGKEKSVVSPKYLQWAVTVITFPSAAKATAAAKTLLAVQKTCPRTSTQTVKGTTETFTRSLGTKYTVGAFSGYRSVEHLSVTDGTVAANLRAFETFLVRGNVMLSLEEVAGATAGNGKEQDTWRKTVTTLMVKRLSAIK